MTDAPTTTHVPAPRGATLPLIPTRTVPDESSPFFRASSRNRFTARTAHVVAVTHPVPQYARVTLTGDGFDDFPVGGPSDHVRVFFPDPATGRLVAPSPAPDGQDGIVRPAEATYGRDFTPLNVREQDGRRVVDIDILLHTDPGPAAHFGATAAVGDTLVLVGPRGSRAATQNAPRVVLVVDPTALPAAGRWLAEVPASTRVDVLADVAGDLGWVEAYLRGFTDRPFTLTAAGADLADAVAAVSPDASTYVFAAGDAARLLSLRRHLRHKARLAREQFAVSGYWRQGVQAWDHHAPIDPADPED